MIRTTVVSYFLSLFFVSLTMYSQEVQVFTKNDFDLNGDVKFCMVVTNYGKEEFNFDKEGYLIKLVTRFNESDYTATHYKYENGELIEKREENYIEGIFDEKTSIAHFYEIDTTLNRKITEKIFSYTNEALDLYEYFYDENEKLVAIKRNNNEGIDDTLIAYDMYKNESTITYTLNGVIEKTIRASEKKMKDGSVKTVLTKQFIEGTPMKAEEQVFDVNEYLISEIKFEYDTITQQFAPIDKTIFSYSEDGAVTSMSYINGKEESLVKEYIYQFDGSIHKNWIKQIITPDNTYKTRSIEYYIEEEASKE